MIKYFFIAVVLFLAPAFCSAQDSNSVLINVWGIDEFVENGKKFEDENMLEIVVDFKPDGKYSYWEENDLIDGWWELSEDGNTIYFDKDTDDEMVWEVVNLDASRLEVKCSYEGRKYRYVFKPKVKQEN
ncbi:MAG: hypothetical protein PHN88_14075 [Ignavibacteria bacterium]|nr:hypothetical protein [Ignavibacteria bacterium]